MIGRPVDSYRRVETASVYVYHILSVERLTNKRVQCQASQKFAVVVFSCAYVCVFWVSEAVLNTHEKVRRTDTASRDTPATVVCEKTIPGI